MSTNPTSSTTSEENVEMKIGMFTSNVSRFIRLNITPQEMYQVIFENALFCIEDIMEKITPESNCKNRHRGFMYGIRLRDRFACKKDPQWIFDQVAKRLKVGPLTMRINIYEGYADSETCSLRVPMKYTGAYRWVAVVGVALTPGMHGGVMFMVQDSCCPDHPFKNIPLDLVYDMNAGDELVYLDIDGKIVLPDSTHLNTNPRDIVESIEKL